MPAPASYYSLYSQHPTKNITRYLTFADVEVISNREFEKKQSVVLLLLCTYILLLYIPAYTNSIYSISNISCEAYIFIHTFILTYMHLKGTRI